jgi:hypothetical protein
MPALSLFQVLALTMIALSPAWQCSAQQPKAESSLVIVSLHPDGTSSGKAFNAQPDAASAIAVVCKGATNTTAIVFAGKKLPTVYGGPTLLTAKVPSELYGKSGRYDVYLVAPSGLKSNIVKFTVK